MTVAFDDVTLEYLGYATARIEGPDGTVVYTDPGRYGVLEGDAPRDGDVVLVTHDHHYDSDGIRRVAAETATVVAFEAVDAAGIDRDVERLADLPYSVRRIGLDAAVTVHDGAVTATATPAHNVPPDRGSHSPGDGCGYRFTVDGRSIFWPGDTDYLPELEAIEASIYLANIGGGPVMDHHDAAELAAAIEPAVVLPIHYDTLAMLEADDEAFAVDVARRSIPVALDAPQSRS